MPPAGSAESRQPSLFEEPAYPSRTIAYQAAGMITSIVEALQTHDQLRYTPAFIVYSLFSALIMHVYQMRSSNQSIVSVTQQRITVCMNALKDVSKVWLVAKMVHTLFESILGNKVLEERLQKAAGRRHQKKPNGYSGIKTKDPTPTELSNDSHKRKFEEMEFGYSNGPPAPQMSYERSRPQSPAITPSRELPQQTQQQHQQLPQLSASNDGPPMKATDAFMGASRSNTRPTTPFNPYSIPGTPPDLFLHTRNSPKISDDLWQNYQPDQLFPPETNGLFPLQSPTQNMVDPALRQPPPQHPGHFAPQMQAQPQPGMTLEHQQTQNMASNMSYNQDPAAWAHLQGMSGQQQSDDQYSNSSYGGPIVPTTLNVGDWFEFFGIPNGGLDGLGGGFS